MIRGGIVLVLEFSPPSFWMYDELLSSLQTSFIEKEIHKEKEEVHNTTIILENLILFYFINNKFTENH